MSSFPESIISLLFGNGILQMWLWILRWEDLSWVMQVGPNYNHKCPCKRTWSQQRQKAKQWLKKMLNFWLWRRNKGLGGKECKVRSSRSQKRTGNKLMPVREGHREDMNACLTHTLDLDNQRFLTSPSPHALECTFHLPFPFPGAAPIIQPWDRNVLRLSGLDVWLSPGRASIKTSKIW